ncbi:hypothetical protein Y032_0530g3005 [Ancylostoma ceylanicum]|uniref:MAM domain-containing protein n=2 Tax=Ancylostoma ceylanicum TaxID=53326 RepID=A0A016WS64_9BILA|nr:hypothetical protein Y032_0530g3005 [Ancylostoma ceylanicum]
MKTPNRNAAPRRRAAEQRTFRSLRFSVELPYLVFIIAIANSTACHSYHQLQQIQAAHAAHARGVTLATNSPEIPLYQPMDKCYFRSPPYNADEILAASTVFPLPDALAVSAGGRITCGFDDEREYCSWHNALDADLKFSKAQRNSFFDADRFECSNPRSFYPSGYFLLVKGDPSGFSRKAVLETTIPCQYDPAVIKFDIWSLTTTPVLRYCVSWANGTGLCENAIAAPNPLNFTIPHSVDPTSVRIEVLNINSQDIILIDSLYYEGRICELIDEEQTTGTTSETLIPIKPSPIEPHLSIRKISRDTIGVQAVMDVPDSEASTDVRDGRAVDEVAPIEELTPIAESALELNADTIERAADFVACEALTCDFNHNHSCFYKLSGFGSTSPWLIGTSFVGNRHTGVQRLNSEDSDRVGFAYVGRDHIDDSNEVFVMESPKFAISTDARLLFDVYLRSHSPRLKVCVDSFDDCPYESPRISKHEFWLLDRSVELRKGVRKVYFIATSVRQNQFLAVDRVRVALDGKPCEAR